MKVAILLLALLSSLACAQQVVFNTDASCSTASGCSLTSILAANIITALTTGNLNLDFSAAGSGLNINIQPVLGVLSSINVASLAVAGRNTITIAAGITVTTANFTVAQSSNAIVNGIVQVQTSGAAVSTFAIDASSALYVTAAGQISSTANIVAQGQANVAGSITTSGSYAQSAGNLVLNSTAEAATAAVYATSITIGSGATLSGNGVIGGSTSAGATATVQVDGTINIGQSPGVVTINGDWRPSATSTFNLEVASSTSFDRLVVSGRAYPNGFCRVTLINSYTPADNSRFTFITAGSTQGSFASTTGTATNTLTKWSSSVTDRSVIANYNSAVSVAVSGLVLVACVLASMM